MRRTTMLSGFLAMVGLSASGVEAVVVLPGDLSPGDPYQLIFVTAGSHDALSTDIGVYDAFVEAEAAMGVSSGLPVISGWRAVVSTPSQAAGTRVFSDGSTPIYNTGGQRVDTEFGIWVGELSNGIGFDQTGTTHYALVWTGTTADGSRQWIKELGSSSGVSTVGLSNNKYSRWVFLTTAATYHDCAIYAISPTLIRGSEVIRRSEPNIPEPTTLLIWSLLAGLGIFWRRRR